jgi:hypothetical protein
MRLPNNPKDHKKPSKIQPITTVSTEVMLNYRE